jgi:hypothetical protein
MPVTPTGFDRSQIRRQRYRPAMTYLPSWEDFLYLAVVTDVFIHKVLDSAKFSPLFRRFLGQAQY